MLVSRWHLSLLCNGREVSSLLASGPAAAAAVAAGGTPGSPVPAGAASAASLLAAAPPAACACTPNPEESTVTREPGQPGNTGLQTPGLLGWKMGPEDLKKCFLAQLILKDCGDRAAKHPRGETAGRTEPMNAEL